MANTTPVRISKINKCIIERRVSANFKNKNPSVKSASFDELLTFLLQEYYKIFYRKIKSEIENEIKHDN